MVMAALVIILILVKRVDLIFEIRDIFVKLFEVGIELLMYLFVILNCNSQGIQCINQCGVNFALSGNQPLNSVRR